MDLKREVDNAGKRLADFAERFDREVNRWQRAAGSGGTHHPLEAGYWRVRDLLAPGMTRDGLKDLDRDARETFRFFSRHVDSPELRGEPAFRSSWQLGPM